MLKCKYLENMMSGEKLTTDLESTRKTHPQKLTYISDYKIK